MMKIGLIAGSGQFPILFSKAAKAKGFPVYAAALDREADAVLERHVEKIEWFALGQVQKTIRFFKKNQVVDVVMLGAVRKTRIFSDIKPDMKALAMVAGMRHTHDDGLLRAFANGLEKEGIYIRSSTLLLPELLAPEGCWTQRKPSRSERADIDLGWHLAKNIGRMDIGQCVVVGGGSVLAVEAIDGTDATIRRGSELGQGTAVVVKVSKPNQDMRFDIPATGVETIKIMKEAGARVLVIEAGKTVVFDREEMIALADQYGLSIVALDDAQMGSDP